MSASTLNAIPTGYTSWRAPSALMVIVVVAGLPFEPDTKRHIMILTAWFGLSNSLSFTGTMLLLAGLFKPFSEFVAYLVYFIINQFPLTKWVGDLAGDHFDVEWLLSMLGIDFFIVAFPVLFMIVSIELYFFISIPAIYLIERWAVARGIRGWMAVHSISVISIVIGAICFTRVMIAIPTMFDYLEMISKTIKHPLQLAYIYLYIHNHQIPTNNNCGARINHFSSPLSVDGDISIYPINNHEIAFGFSSGHLSDVEYHLTYTGPLAPLKTPDGYCFASREIQHRLPEILQDSKLQLGRFPQTAR